MPPTPTDKKVSPAAEAPVRSKTKKRMRTVTRAQAHITATYNNTIVTITDMDGNALAWSSSGHMGFKGPKKSTPYAAGIVVRDCMERLKNAGIREMQVYVRGVGSGREAAIRALNAQGVTVSLIKDVTPVPHNGPRPKKPRRV